MYQKNVKKAFLFIIERRRRPKALSSYQRFFSTFMYDHTLHCGRIFIVMAYKHSVWKIY